MITLAQALVGMAAMFLAGFSFRGLVEFKRRQRDALAKLRDSVGRKGGFSDDFEPGPTFMSGRPPPKKR